MTADRSGLTVSNATLRWFNVLIAVCAVLGPCGAYFVNKWTTASTVTAVYGERLTRAERDIGELKNELNTKLDRLDGRFDKIDGRLQNIEQGLARIQGAKASADGARP